MYRLFSAGPPWGNQRLLDDERPYWSPRVLAPVHVRAQMLLHAGEADESLNLRSNLQTI